MRTSTATLRILLVLATLSLYTQSTFASSSEEKKDITALVGNHVKNKELAGRSFRTGRMLKRSNITRRSSLSKRRRQKDDEDEDSEDDEEQYNGDDTEARQFVTSDDMDDKGSGYTTDSYGNRVSDSDAPLDGEGDDDNGDDGDDDDSDDQVVADPNAGVQVKPALLSSSALSSIASNAKATLTRGAAITSSSTASNAASTTGPRTSFLVSSSSTTHLSTSTSSSSSSSTSSTSSSSTASTTSSSSATSSSPTSTSAATTSTDTDSPTSSASPTDDEDSSDGDNDDDSATSAPFTTVWSAFNKSSKWFPVAVIVAILIGIAALVIIVASLQCIARSARFSKKQQERPLLIPSDSSWGGSDTSRRSSLLSNEKRGSIASLPASRVASTIGAHRNRDTYTAFPARPSAGQGHRPSSSSLASLVKEDFLPHSYDPEPEVAYLSSIYPALERRSQSPAYNSSSPIISRRSTPAPTLFPYPETLPTLQRMQPALAYPYNSPNHAFGNNPYRTPVPSRLPSLPHIPRMRESSLSRLPSILTPGRSPSPAAFQQQQQSPQPYADQGPNSRVRHSYSISSSTAGYSQYGPRPGRDERQSVARASLNEQMLEQQMGRKGGIQFNEAPRLPVGVMERRRWERCAT